MLPLGIVNLKQPTKNVTVTFNDVSLAASCEISFGVL